MVISTAKDILHLEGDKAKVALLKKGKADGKLDADIVLTPTALEKEQDAFIIFHPGEYESKDIFVYALDTNKSGIVDIFSMDIDGVQVVYIGPDTIKVKNSTVEQIGVDHILIMDFDSEEKLEEKLALVSEFEPEVFIPLGDAELLKKVSKELGVELPEEVQSKAKYTVTDFGNEEASLEIVLLK